jgi:hypothetical protein
VHLNLSDNQMGAGGAERLAGVLPSTPASLSAPPAPSASSLAGVLPQCAALAHLNLGGNGIDNVLYNGEERLRASWLGQASGLVLV